MSGPMWNTAPFRSPLQGTRVLVAEDVADERNLLANYLQQLGCRVFLAVDGRDALLKALVVKPDILLMDIGMPACDGLTVCRMLKEDGATRAIPVIFLTGAALPEERVDGLRAGAVDYVTKPFDFEEIRLRLSIHLPGRDAPRPDPDGDLDDTNPLDHTLFMLARRILLENLSADIDPVQLAKAIRCNPRRMNEAFRRCVGVTAMEYLREQRMSEARRLLAETSLPVQEVALRVGFSGGANFATAFRERFGASPTAFRKVPGPQEP